LTLGYATPLLADGVTIRETYGNGFVTKVELRNASTGVFETVWAGTDPTQPGSPADFAISFDRRSYLVDAGTEKGTSLILDRKGDITDIDGTNSGNSLVSEPWGGQGTGSGEEMGERSQRRRRRQ
jgi:hypothetical protein